MSNSIAPGSSAAVNVNVTALTTNPNVPVTYKTIILKKNLVNGVNTLTQAMINQANTKYIIKYDYLLGEDITIPAGCILEFDGGSISGTYVLDLNFCNIVGKGLKCEISNPYLGITPKLSDYLCDISNPTLNRKVIQALADSNYNLALEIDINDQIILDAPIEIRHLDIKGGNLYFNNSDGFKFSHAVYSSSNFVDRLTIRSKGHCFDFFVSDNYVHNIYTSSFININAYSEEGSCFYAGPNKYTVGGSSDYIVFDCKFERIWVGAPNGAGFYGFHSNTMLYRKIDGSAAFGIAYFYNCVGFWDSVNGIWNIGYENFLKLDANIGANAVLTFINCNFEGFKNSVIDANDNSYVRVIFFSCNFILEQGTDSYYPLKINLLQQFTFFNCTIMTDNSGSDAFVYIQNINNGLTCNSDKGLKIKDSTGRYNYIGSDLGTLRPYNGYLSGNFSQILYNEDLEGNISRNRVKCKSIVPTWTDITLVENQFLPFTEEDYLNITVAGNIIGLAGVTYGKFYKVYYIKNGSDGNITFVPNQWPAYKIITENGSNLTIAPNEIVKAIYYTETKRLYIFNNINENNFVISGSTRPTNPYKGQQFFDEDLTPKRPIWYNGSDWVDATGQTV